MQINVDEDVVFAQPTSADEREHVAEACVLHLDLSIPTLVDDMENSVDDAYAAWPERLFVVDVDGRIAYASGQGPFGFKPKHVRRWLRRNIGRP